MLALIITIIAIFGFKNGFGLKPCDTGNMYFDDVVSQCKSCLKDFDSTCTACSSPTNCTSCEKGYYLLNDTSGCQDCSLTLTDSCLSCSSASKCTSCQDSMLLVNGVCENCNYYNHCLTCSGNKCTACESNFVVQEEGKGCRTCEDTCSDCV